MHAAREIDFFHLLGSHFYKCTMWALKLHELREKSIFFFPLFFLFIPLFTPHGMTLLCQAAPHLLGVIGREDRNHSLCPLQGGKSSAPKFTGGRVRGFPEGTGQGDCSWPQEREILCPTQRNYLGAFSKKPVTHFFFFFFPHPRLSLVRADKAKQKEETRRKHLTTHSFCRWFTPSGSKTSWSGRKHGYHWAKYNKKPGEKQFCLIARRSTVIFC